MRDISTVANQVLQETEKIIVGKQDKIRLIIMAVLADGHVLLDDLPGVGKTTLVKTLSIALGCDSRRVQFVPDLLPSDPKTPSDIHNRLSCKTLTKTYLSP